MHGAMKKKKNPICLYYNAELTGFVYVFFFFDPVLSVG